MVTNINEKEKGCDNCLNKCMDMDMEIYCAAVNKPWGRNLRSKPEECGTENKLWQIDIRRSRSFSLGD